MAIELRDGVTGDDLSDAFRAASAGALLAELLDSIWEESGRDQVYVCVDGGVVAWVMVAPKPVESADGSELGNVVLVTHVGGPVERERFRVTYHFDQAKAAGEPSYLRTEVVRV